MFKFIWWFILFLLPLPLLTYKILPRINLNRGQALWVPFFSQYQNNHSIQHKKFIKRKFFLAWLIWCCLLFAAARPQWIGEPLRISHSGRDLMLAVDVSNSMEFADMVIQQRQVDRLTAVKWVITDFLAQRTADRIGLILFGSKAYLQAPLTFDHKTIKQFLLESQIGMAGPQTAIGDGIGLAIKHLKQHQNNSRVLILVTDGANTAGVLDPIQAAKFAAEINLKIYVIGIGASKMVLKSPFGSFFSSQVINPAQALDENTLQEIAKITQGQYFRAEDTQQLQDIYQLLDELEPMNEDEVWLRPKQDLFRWPLLMVLICSILWTCNYLLSLRQTSSDSCSHATPYS